MNELIEMARRGGHGARWDEHFKTLLLLLLETLGDQQVISHNAIHHYPTMQYTAIPQCNTLLSHNAIHCYPTMQYTNVSRI